MKSPFGRETEESGGKSLQNSPLIRLVMAISDKEKMRLKALSYICLFGFMQIENPPFAGVWKNVGVSFFR